MPSLHDGFVVLYDDFLYLAKLMCSIPKVTGQANRFQPKLGGASVLIDMDMRRFDQIMADEVKSIRPVSQDGRHLNNYITASEIRT